MIPFDAPRAAFALLLIGLVVSGCYSGQYLTRSAVDSTAIRTARPNTNRAGFPVYLASIHANLPGEETEPPYELTRILEESGFHPLVTQVPLDGAFIEARLDVYTRPHDDEEDWNLAKLGLTALSAFLLAPALPQTHDYESIYQLQARWPNGSQRRYTATCGAHAYATIDKYRDSQRAAMALKRNACLVSLANQLNADDRRLTPGEHYVRPEGITNDQLPDAEKARRGLQDIRLDPAAVSQLCVLLGLKPDSGNYRDCLSQMTRP
jgi:hypothetical protein